LKKVLDSLPKQGDNRGNSNPLEASMSYQTQILIAALIPVAIIGGAAIAKATGSST